MAVSIADMERVALGGDSLRFDDGGIGNVIELGDLNDDLGLNMLMNPSKTGGYGGGGNGSSGMVTAVPDSSRTINITSFTPTPQPSYSGGGGRIGIDATPLEPLEPIAFDSAPIDMNEFGARPIDVSVKKDNGGGMFGGLFGNSQSASRISMCL